MTEGLSRGVVLEWINDLLDIRYQKVEEACNGAAFCQVMDALYPGSVNMKKVNFNTKTENDMIANYKLLQEAFDKKQIKHSVDVDTLIKGKMMASLETLQWFKTYFDQNYQGNSYDGAARRSFFGIADPGKDKTKRRPPITQRSITSAKSPIRNTGVKILVKSQNTSTNRNERTNKEDETTKLTKQIEALKAEIAILREDNQTLLEERNFYFDKLTRIEDLCRENDNEFVKNVQDILFECDEEHGFVDPTEFDI